MQCIVAALVIGILFFMFVARVVNVEGSSMFPTLHNSDKIITSNLFYKPKAGDVVVVQTDTYGSDPLVKRIIATAGQTVDIDFDAGIVYVDGEALDEPYTNSLTLVQEDFTGPVTVPEGCLFLMGDNRNYSTDSRSNMVGMVDERCVIGKVYLIIIPSANEDGSRDWGRIGSIYN
ncbi:MAG: signal peptidase I [Oscillospiraceae bacterium]